MHHAPPNPQLSELLQALQQHASQPIMMGLERVETLCAQVGNPYHRLPPVIHLAGTNGKGSLSAFLHALANAAGLSAHRYISPHLVRFNERIIVADQEISDQQLMECLQAVEGPARALGATYFESTTVAAYLAFAQVPADLLILETGMGGRLDATNIITPILTAITPVSMDHQAFLGDTLEAIAGEKAGILKAGIPCVIGPQMPQALDVLRARAEVLRCPLSVYGEDWRVEPQSEEGCFTYVSNARWLDDVRPSLLGRHQYENAATAIACFDALSDRWPLTEVMIRRGVAQATWPARLQKLSEGRLLELLPAQTELWLDGGHNAGAAAILRQWILARERPVHVVCGMLADKDHAEFFQIVGEAAASLACLTIPETEHAASSEQLYHAAQSAAQKFGIHVEKAESLAHALQALCKTAVSSYDVLICGSLYLAGYVLAQNEYSEQ